MVAVAMVEQTTLEKEIPMWFRSLFDALLPRSARTPAQPRRHAPTVRQRHGSFRPHLQALEDRWVPSTLTVTNALDTGVAGDGSLRGEIAAAQSGDTINFASSLRGQTITLTGGELAITKNLDIEGPGANQLTVSGNGASRVFDISGGVTVTIAGMTMTDGLANGSSPVVASTGGGILNFGSLTLANDVLSNNQAVGDAGTSPTGRVGGALGGAVANLGSGSLTISNSAFTANQALGADHSVGASAGNALGGAIVNSATASVSGSRFTHNVARGGSDCTGSLDATGAGGGINNSGSLTVTNSTFSHNQAIGGNDSSCAVRPGFGVGGAILTGGPRNPAVLVVSGSTFDHNQAIGGHGNQSSSNPAPSLNGPNGAAGGAFHLSGGTATISGCTVEHNAAIAGAGGPSQSGGLAWGGGLDTFNGFGNGVVVTVSDSTISHNSAIGGAGGPGGDGGDGWGGGLANLLGSVLTLSGSTVAHNRAVGGAGGSGGNGADGEGGGIFQDGLSTLTLLGTTVGHNLALGGAAGIGGSDGEGEGGGLYLEPGGLACADLLTAIAGNHASTSDDDVFGDLGVC
jgi:hypothetical protein